jgi:AcrR family transcriptional regulator
MSRPDVASRIKEAAILVVAEDSLSNLSVRSICARAGVTEASFRKLWPDAWSAMLEALDEHLTLSELPDRGSLPDDLAALALAYHKQLSDPSFTAFMFRLLAAAQLDPSLRSKLGPGYFFRRAQNRVVIERAVAGGELASEADGDAFLDAILRLVFSWLGANRTPSEQEVRTAIGGLMPQAENTDIGSS